MSKISLLSVVALMCGTSLAHGQVAPAYYGYPTGYGQPIQQVNYQGGGSQYYPSRAYVTPSYVTRGNYPDGSYGYNNSYGVNYYYAKNPTGFSATPAAYSAVANNRAVSQPTGWPAPGGAATVSEACADTACPAPIVPSNRAFVFHRPTREAVWISADYLGTFIRPMRFAGPLVTTGSPLDASPGALGNLSTTVLYGNQAADFNLMSGFRAEAGLFLDQKNRYSMEFAAFYVFQGRQQFNIEGDSTGNPVVTRPFFKVDTQQEGGLVNSLPGLATGSLQATTTSQFGGFEINFRQHHYVKERLHTDFLFGIRYMRLTEELQVLENIRGLAPGFLTFVGAPIGLDESLIDSDSFRTANQFLGPQFGGRLSWEHKWWTSTAFAKIGVGATHQQATIAGSTTKVSANGNDVVSGSILALPTNIGNHSRTVFGILPEFGFNLGVDVTEHVRIKLGYSLLMWNKVLRPGSQYELNINPGQIPGSSSYGKISGPFAPVYRFNDEFFWAQSLMFGVEAHY